MNLYTVYDTMTSTFLVIYPDQKTGFSIGRTGKKALATRATTPEWQEYLKHAMGPDRRYKFKNS